jgi:hypothetical protein
MKEKLDEFHYHEMLERAFLAGQIMELLGKHPVSTEHKEVQDQVIKIIDECAELYQIVGELRNHIAEY